MINKEYIFAENKYFQSCHASTLIELGDGDFLVCWFGGAAEGKEDVAIWGSTRLKGIWKEPVKIVKVDNTAHWNRKIIALIELNH